MISRSVRGGHQAERLTTWSVATPAGAAPAIPDQVWKFSGDAAKSGVATVEDAAGNAIGVLHRQCGDPAPDTAPGAAVGKALCTDLIVWTAEKFQVSLVAPVPPADGVTEYTETITGGALAYDGADGNAHVTPVSATEYKVGFSGAGAGA